jgi:hypothetical protein
MISQVLGVHRDSNSQNESSFGSVSVYCHTLPHSWAPLLARTLANPCLGHEPKARVATILMVINGYWWIFYFKYWWLLMVIILMIIGAYSIGGH